MDEALVDLVLDATKAPKDYSRGAFVYPATSAGSVDHGKTMSMMVTVP